MASVPVFIAANSLIYHSAVNNSSNNKLRNSEADINIKVNENLNKANQSDEEIDNLAKKYSKSAQNTVSGLGAIAGGAVGSIASFTLMGSTTLTALPLLAIPATLVAGGYIIGKFAIDPQASKQKYVEELKEGKQKAVKKLCEFTSDVKLDDNLAQKLNTWREKNACEVNVVKNESNVNKPM